MSVEGDIGRQQGRARACEMLRAIDESLPGVRAEAASDPAAAELLGRLEGDRAALVSRWGEPDAVIESARPGKGRKGKR